MAEGGVEVHLQSGGAVGEAGGLGGIVGAGPQELSIITAGFEAGRSQGQVEGLCVEDGRFGVGHGQHQRHAPGQGGRSAAVPIFLVGGAGFAHVHVRVDQAG